MPSLRSLVGSELMLVKQHIAGIRQIVPNHIRLSASERRSLFKLSAKRQEFVQKSFNYMRQHSSELPSFIDIAGCNNDLHLYQQCAEVIKELEQLQEKLEDARVFLGNRIMKQTRGFFLHARGAAEAGHKGFQDVYDDLKPHYAVGRNSTSRRIK
ncbi:MAG: hypothetical protein IM591_07660 [Chitinophagaceae bacterium]|nr:hypothetical protein [Chitinophagaceae bacterium]